MKVPGEPDQQLGSGARVRWSELDIVRGLAVIFMIANHLGVSTPASENSPTVSFLTFLGSMAPVLFFVVTGLGYGVGSTWKGRKSGDQYLTKLGILYAADAFLWLQPGRLVGNNFLGFIALSGLLLERIRRSSRSLQVSLALAVLVTLTRFGIGPWVRSHHGFTYDGGWVPFLMGIGGMEGFAYPPCPWLVYPLLGFALGRIAGLNAPRIMARRGAWGLGLLVVAAGFSAIGMWHVSRGSTLFRWGTMSISFFLITLGVIPAALAVSLFLCRGDAPSTLGRLITLGGVRSLAVVPLHYLYRDLSLGAGMRVVDLPGYLVWLANGLPLCFESSKLVPMLAGFLQKRGLERPAKMTIGLMAVMAAILLFNRPLHDILDLLLRSAAQLGLCLLFGLMSGGVPSLPRQKQ